MDDNIINLLNGLKECFMTEVWGNDTPMEGYENVTRFIDCINQLQSGIESIARDRDYYKLKYGHYLIESGRMKRKADEES